MPTRQTPPNLKYLNPDCINLDPKKSGNQKIKKKNYMPTSKVSIVWAFVGFTVCTMCRYECECMCVSLCYLLTRAWLSGVSNNFEFVSAPSLYVLKMFNCLSSPN